MAPIRSYKCLDCDSEPFEHLELGSDDSHPQCNECNSLRVTRTITAPGNYFIRGNNTASERPKGIGKKNRGAK